MNCWNCVIHGREGETQGPGNLRVFQPREIVQLDDLRLLRRLTSQRFEGVVHGQHGFIAVLGGEVDVLQIHALQIAAVAETGLLARAIHEDPPHGLGRRAKEMTAAVPQLLFVRPDQPQPGFVNERGGLQGLPAFSCAIFAAASLRSSS